MQERGRGRRGREAIKMHMLSMRRGRAADTLGWATQLRHGGLLIGRRGARRRQGEGAEGVSL